jgi:hypothetical protein
MGFNFGHPEGLGNNFFSQCIEDQGDRLTYRNKTKNRPQQGGIDRNKKHGYSAGLTGHQVFRADINIRSGIVNERSVPDFNITVIVAGQGFV